MEISNAAADQLAEVIASYVNDSGDDRVQLIGEVLGEDSSGTTWVHILGGEQRTPVTSTNAKVHKGDIVYVVIGDGRADILGNVSRPSTDDTLAEVVQQRVVETERVVERIEATAITADSAEIQQLHADHAVIETLDSTYASIGSLTAATARIGDIEADYLKTADMTAEQARVGQLMAGKADVADLTAANARIDSLESTKADISVLESDYITADAIDATYLHADMSNADVAWIQNGVIKDAAISDAQIIGVSANKLTAGTIDASNINVTNLRADNLKVTRINGQPVIGGYALVDPSSSGYSSKNPKAQGWYELSGSSYVATNDTSVVSGKNYYSTSDYAELYDQDAIDGMVDSLNNRIDAQIETWTTDAVPTLNNYPASSWTTSDARAEHVGDICYVMNAGNDYDGYTYRFAYDNSTSSYKWVLIKDNQVTAALGRISDLETFESETSTWIDETDEGLRTIRSNHTALAGRVDKVVKSSVQLWYTKANETAPSAPSSVVTSTSTSGNGWRTVVPTYNSSYPFYFYCWQYQYEDGTYDWSAVVYDRATSESEERARTGVTNAASAQTTANANIKSSVQLWFTKANDTAPSKPSGTNPITVSDASKRNQWNLVVPTYSDSYPYYFYCYQQQKGDNTYQWTDVVYDEATSTAMKKAQGALPSSTFATFEQTTFKEVVDDVDEQSTKITTLTTITENNGLTETTNISNTVNQVSQTASGNSAKLSNITETIGANADGTNPSTKSLIARTSAVEQTLEGFQTTVTNVQRTAEEANDRGVAYSGTSSTEASTADKVAACTNFELVAGATVTVRFSAANTSTGAITLNVNNTGKRTVYVNGAATSSSNQLLWGANANVTFTYDGSYWRIVSEPRPWVGSCAVAAATAAKTATINEVVICKGTSVTLNMTYSNTSASATLNVTSTGAKNIYYGTTSTRPTTENGYGWTDASTQTFVFDGAYWRIGDTSALAGLATANGILSSHTTQIAQNAQNIEMKADSSEVYTKTQVDGKITQEVNDRNSAIEQSASAINFSVSQNYTTKTEFDNLEIGGRNLLYKRVAAGGRVTANGDYSIILNASENLDTYFTLYTRTQLVEGNTYVISCEASGINGDGVFYKFPLFRQGSTIRSLTIDKNGINSFSFVMNATELGYHAARTVDDLTVYAVMMDDVERNIEGQTGPITLTNFKLEKGNKPTDWTPAPEDAGAYTDAQISAAKSEIKVTTDGISSTVSKISSVKYVNSTTSSWPLASIKTYAAEGRSASWGVNSTDGLRVGDTVYVKGTDGTRQCPVYIKITVTAIDSATSFTGTSHGYEDVLPVDTIKSTINQSSDSVKIQAKHVEIDGAAIFSNSDFRQAADNAYDAKGAATDAVNNLEIGGRNLFVRSESVSGYLETSGSIVSQTAAHERTSDYIKVSPNETYILQCWKLSGASSNIWVSLHEYTSGKTRIKETVREHIAGDYKSYTIVTSANTGYVRISARYQDDSAWFQLVKFEKGNKPTDWSLAPEDTINSTNLTYEKILSKGLQLVTNGNGYMRDNTNWPALSFDGTMANVSPGSFTKSVSQSTLYSEEAFPIDVEKQYVFEFDAISSDGTGRLYAFLPTYDVDDKAIGATNVMYIPGTLTTLASDLNAGDTTVKLTSAAGWKTPTSYAYQRSLIFWDYKNSNGYTYPPETYSRNWYSGAYSDDSKVDKSTGVITLASPWSGPKKPAGTQVSQGNDGGTYVYSMTNVQVPSTWTHYYATINGLDTTKDGYDSSGKFRQGSAFARVGFLWNYGASGGNQGQIWVTNVSVKEATVNQASLTEVKNNAVKRTQRIWYRKEAAGAPATPSSWVVKLDDGSNTWTKMHVSITDTEKFIYTCEQYEMANGTIGYTSVLLDNTITVIDGGSIITGSVTANQIAAGTITGEQIAGDTIEGVNIKGNAITAEHLSSAFSLDLGKVDGLNERLESIEGGISGLQNNTQWVHYDQTAGTVFGETGSANNVTVTGSGIDFNTDEGRAAWATGGVFHANEMEAETIDTKTITMGDWAIVQSGSSFYIDYIGS